MDLHERLAWARKNAGYPSARAAAEALHVNPNSYVQHENGIRGFKRDAASLYARKFKVSYTWLMEGKGKPLGREQCPIAGTVGAGAEIIPIAEGDALDEFADSPPGLEADAVAVRVRGDSMWPICDEGDLIFYDRRTADISIAVNKLCVVWLEDGRVFLKRLRKGSTAGRFVLESFNSGTRPIEDVKVQQVALVRWIKRQT